MTKRYIIQQTSFQNGMVGKNQIAKTVGFALQSARNLTNMVVTPLGGAKRRPGFTNLYNFLTEPNAKSESAIFQHYTPRLIPTEWGKTNGLVFVMTAQYRNGPTKRNGYITLLQSNGLFTRITHDYTDEQVKNFRFADTAAGIIACHPDLMPFILTHEPFNHHFAATHGWGIKPLTFANLSSDPLVTIPAMPYETMPMAHHWLLDVASDLLQLTSDQLGQIPVGASVTLTADNDYFISPPANQANQASHLDIIFKLYNGYVRLTEIQNPRRATAITLSPLTNVPAPNLVPNANRFTQDVKEQAFSNLRGYPKTAGFWQGRLILAGHKTLPNRVWGSALHVTPIESQNHNPIYNFDLGKANATDAISFSIGQATGEKIEWLHTKTRFHIHSNLAVWAVSANQTPNNFITASNLSLQPYLTIGIADHADANPIEFSLGEFVSGSCFIGADRKTIHHIQWSELHQQYNHQLLNGYADEFLTNLTSLTHDATNQRLYAVKTNGKVMVLCYNRNPQTPNPNVGGESYGLAWCQWQMDGAVSSAAMVQLPPTDEALHQNSLHQNSLHQNSLVLLQKKPLPCYLDDATAPQHLWSLDLSPTEPKTEHMLADGLTALSALPALPINSHQPADNTDNNNASDNNANTDANAESGGAMAATITLPIWCLGKTLAIYTQIPDGTYQLRQITTAPRTNPLTLAADFPTNQSIMLGVIFESILEPLYRFSGPESVANQSACKLQKLSFLVEQTPLISWRRLIDHTNGTGFTAVYANHYTDPKTTNNAPDNNLVKNENPLPPTPKNGDAGEQNNIGTENNVPITNNRVGNNLTNRTTADESAGSTYSPLVLNSEIQYLILMPIINSNNLQAKKTTKTENFLTNLTNLEIRLNPATLALPLQPFSGWAVEHLLGWYQAVTGSYWQIICRHPYPLEILAVKEEYLTNQN